MNNKTKAKLPGIFIIFCLLVAILTYIKIGTGEKKDKRAVIKKDIALPANDTLSDTIDLYYLKHPYLIKADQLNDEGNYDSAIHYYNEAALKFEKEHQWENYVWVNGYIGRLYLYIAGENFENASPYLHKAFEKGTQNLRGNHPYLAITYYYFGLYYYNKKLADTSLQMLNKALDILLKFYKEDNIYTADVYDATGDVYANLMFEHTSAETNYLKSIKVKEAFNGEGKKSSLTSGYYNLVKLSSSINDFEKAQSYCYAAIENVKYVKSHQFYWLELLEGALAKIYSEQEIYEKAIGKLNNAILLNYKNNGDKSYISFYYAALYLPYYRIQQIIFI